MSATATPVRIDSVAPIHDQPDHVMDDLIEGLQNGTAGVTTSEIEDLVRRESVEYDNNASEALKAWNRQVMDPAIEEVASQVAELLDAAIARRLPWEWPEL